jgi:hypothetical protein
MRCANPRCDLSQAHKPPCKPGAGELRAELEELRARLKKRPDDERVKGEIAIVQNHLQAARRASK